MNQYSLSLLAIIGGVFLAAQGGLNSNLGVLLKNPLMASVAAFFSSTVFAIVFIFMSSKNLPTAAVIKEIPIYFINTGYHFKETLIYKQYLTQLYELNVIDIQAEQNKHAFTQATEMWKNQPNRCCHINKVEPLDFIKGNYSIWVSGLMRWQSDFRSSLNFFEPRENMTKFYPLLDIDFVERDNFIRDHHLPFHPLKSKGYSSIGCEHCTVPSDDRSGRWNNSPKTECGLHL